MKKILFVAFIAGATLLSCSKKKNPVPANTVSINGTTYSTVKIGTQTWTSVNYNGTGGTNYDGSTTNATNNPTYGKLYTLAEAQDAAKNLPTGWRLPTVTDMNTLLHYLGGADNGSTEVHGDLTTCSKLKSISDWQYTQGNNSSGFNAYPTGSKYSGNYQELNIAAAFWTSSADSQGNQYFLYIYDDANTMNDFAETTVYAPNEMLSIRFVKDN